MGMEHRCGRGHGFQRLDRFLSSPPLSVSAKDAHVRPVPSRSTERYAESNPLPSPARLHVCSCVMRGGQGAGVNSNEAALFVMLLAMLKAD